MSRTPPINRRIFTSPLAGRSSSHAPEEHEKTGGDSISRARALRTNATPAERILWASLRTLKGQGFHFRRHAPIGPYIADFVCKRCKVVVELDGSQHAEWASIDRDKARTAYLNKFGYRVLRFWNDEVFANRDGVMDAIVHALAPTRPAARDDLPRRGR
jgi:very-short-patch-repair endonuclease